MAYYLKGIGDRLSGTNEILPQLDARMISFLVGQQHGIITGELNEHVRLYYDRQGHTDPQRLNSGVGIFCDER